MDEWASSMIPSWDDSLNDLSVVQGTCMVYNYSMHEWDVFVSPAQPGSGRFAQVPFPYPSDKPSAGTAFPLFPVLSGYWKAENYWDDHGNVLIAFTGYYDNETTFTATKNNLLAYLGREGNITTMTLDLNQVLRSSEDPCLREINATSLNAVQYISPDTAGYFLFHENPDFPGDPYRIEYYGTTGIAHSVPEISAGSWYGQGYRAQNTANLSAADETIRELIVTKIYNLFGTRIDSAEFDSTQSPEPSSAFFPALSLYPYYAGTMHVFLSTGKRFDSEVWIFKDANEFNRQRSELIRYLNETGNVSTSSLELTGESGLFGAWNVTRYESRNTSGYFFTSYDYAILYDGVVGPADLQENSYPIQLLIADTMQYTSLSSESIGPLDSPRAVPSTTSPTQVPINIYDSAVGIVIVLVVAGIIAYWRYKS